MSKYLDSNGLLYVKNKILAWLGGKVDKVEGKQLSTNDYTSAEKTKLAGLSAYTHPTGDGNHHVPATGTSNSGKFLRAGATAGSEAWGALTKQEIVALGIPGQDTTYGAATSSANGLMTKEDKSKLDAFGAASTYALKSELSSLYKYKGSKATTGELPASGNVTGDVWNVESDGMNYAWTGSAWDALGVSFTTEAITNAEIDTIFDS